MGVLLRTRITCTAEEISAPQAGAASNSTARWLRGFAECDAETPLVR